MMQCDHREWTDKDEILPSGERCTAEATHRGCQPFTGSVTCAAHKCRCAKLIGGATVGPIVTWGIFLKKSRVREITGDEAYCRAAASVLSNYPGQFEAKPLVKCGSCDGRGVHEDESIGMAGECPSCDGGYTAAS
jgi:hypothetical protein